MLAERQRDAQARRAGLRREIARQVIEPRRRVFAYGFRLMQRFQTEPDKLDPSAAALAEAFMLAMDPGWDAAMAWNYSIARERALAEASAREEAAA